MNVTLAASCNLTAQRSGGHAFQWLAKRLAMTLQNRAGLALMTANTAGSEPSGSSVAEIKLMIKTDVRPTSGAASTCSSQAIADSIIGFFEREERCPL